jgi:hypothetical protein
MNRNHMSRTRGSLTTPQGKELLLVLGQAPMGICSRAKGHSKCTTLAWAAFRAHTTAFKALRSLFGCKQAGWGLEQQNGQSPQNSRLSLGLLVLLSKQGLSTIANWQTT